VHFVWWFARPEHIGYPPLFWLLSISLGFKLLRMLHEWYHYVQVSVPQAPQPVAAAPAPAYSVDVLTTACPGEPLAMIEATLRAMQAITYPHTSYLCDEGDDPYLRQLCQQLGVVHVTRPVKVDAKAGNINNALRQATGELCVVLDPDHAPTPDFLDQVVGYFADPRVGYVQVVQAYGNQQESLIARGAAEQTYHFYGPLMMGMNAYNTAQAIGANCTFRRAALDSIGGHAAGLTEDMHTALRLHAQGWKSVYAPVIVSRGLVPASLAAYYAQQLKWARGSFELLLTVVPRLWARLSGRQRLHYATLPLYFFSGVIVLIDLAIPIA
ncbi:glycosyltransferase family 2 protein, partial [Hymenobacter sp. HD11105]